MPTSSAHPSLIAVTRFSILTFGITFVIGTDTFLVAPLLPTLSNEYRIGTEVSGWLVSGYSIGYAAFALVAGPISDRVNRKAVVIAGLAAFALSTAASGLAPNFWAMIVLRALAGMAASLVVPQIWATIPVAVPADRVLSTMGYGTAGLSIAQVVGVPAGSILAATNWRIPFFVLGAVSLLVMAAVAVWFPSVPSVAAGNGRILSSYRSVLGLRRAAWYLAGYLVFGIGLYTVFTFIGTWYTRAFGLSVTQVGLAIIGLGAGNAIGSMFASRLANQLGLPKSVLLGGSVLAVLCVALPFAPVLPVAEATLMLIFLVSGFVFPVLMTVMQSLSTTARGTVASLANAALYTAASIGGVISGVLFTTFHGFYGVAFLSAVAFVAALLLYVRGGLRTAPTQAQPVATSTKPPESVTPAAHPIADHDE
ncbi:MFS transporter [Micromonospora polyrhachis]|uniref:Putative MFS family arabinose efflux permease n=1 Tax=Micromonospora polyrhachis TaxID=1282883 RepID=A0A7W7SM91_9ACTN|nr:MFS transporter [Micromonospora polyrhachis]MBB4957374.1 putative MFS family arabinose efflux permease [Micromonospora polyrhachis]